jgi:hypothetical protein
MKAHPRAGEPTYFEAKLYAGLGYEMNRHKFDSEAVAAAVELPKIHTIRANYEEWARRIEEVRTGEAVLRVQYWIDVPFRSKVGTICDLTTEHEVGCQKVTFDRERLNSMRIDGNIVSDLRIVAGNDGLSFDDFHAWFDGYDLSKPMAMIHFTPFRY